MIDRSALARQAQLPSDQVEAAMVNALKALSLLRDPESLPQLEKLGKEDPNLRVRDAARKALAAAPRRRRTRVNGRTVDTPWRGNRAPSVRYAS